MVKDASVREKSGTISKVREKLDKFVSCQGNL